jgi:hypothetical protein
MQLRPGYASDTPKVSLKPGDNLTGVNIHMRVTDSSKIASGNSGPTGKHWIGKSIRKVFCSKVGLINLALSHF